MAAGVSVTLAALLVPARFMSESSVRTAPASAVNVNVPKFRSLPAWSPNRIAAVLPALSAVRLAVPVTLRSAFKSSVMSPAVTSVRLPPTLLLPVSSVPESSVIVAAASLTTVSRPKFRSLPAWSPNRIAAVLPALSAVRLAVPITLRSALESSVMSPALTSVRFPPTLLLPVSSVPESSVIAAAASLTTVSRPKFRSLPACSPKRITAVFDTLSAVRLAVPVTLRSAPASSVMSPALTSVRLPPTLLLPVSSVPESSVIAAAASLTTVNRPKFRSLPAWSPSRIAAVLAALSAVRLAVPVTLRSAPASSVMSPALTSVRLSAVLLPVNCVPESSLMLTGPATLNARLPKLVVSAQGCRPG